MDFLENMNYSYFQKKYTFFENSCKKNMKKFRNCEKEVIDFIIEHFTSDFTELYRIEPM